MSGPDVESLTVTEREGAETALAATEAPAHDTLRPIREAAARSRDRKRIEMVD